MLNAQIADAARTVAHVQVYFAELKAAARAWLASGSARQRGYFTPAEDDEVRHLLISYSQARNALLDLVLRLRDDEALLSEDYHGAFLVGFAGALLLVDAAMFLHESFHHEPIIRQKLNEPEPHFGIQGGTYDAIQQSLTSLRHRWHLHHAREFLRQHEAALRSRAADPLLQPALAIIDELGERARVPTIRAAQERLHFGASKTLRRLRFGLVGQAMYGMQKLVSSLMAHVYTRPGHVPTLPGSVRSALGGVLQPGDVLVTRKEYAVTNYFLPGYFPHAALYLGDAQALSRLGIWEHEHVRSRWERLSAPPSVERERVLEAMADGVWVRPLGGPMRCDALAVLRPRISTADIAQALVRGLFHEGKAYDFDFDFTRSDRLVCTEVVYRSYEGVGGLEFALQRRAGRLTLATADLLRLALEQRGWNCVALHAPQATSDLLLHEQATSTLARLISRAANEC